VVAVDLHSIEEASRGARVATRTRQPRVVDIGSLAVIGCASTDSQIEFGMLGDSGVEEQGDVAVVQARMGTVDSKDMLVGSHFLNVQAKVVRIDEAKSARHGTYHVLLVTDAHGLLAEGDSSDSDIGNQLLEIVSHERGREEAFDGKAERIGLGFEVCCLPGNIPCFSTKQRHALAEVDKRYKLVGELHHKSLGGCGRASRAQLRQKQLQLWVCLELSQCSWWMLESLHVLARDHVAWQQQRLGEKKKASN
jgi:hypothetical protein